MDQLAKNNYITIKLGYHKKDGNGFNTKLFISEKMISVLNQINNKDTFNFAEGDLLHLKNEKKHLIDFVDDDNTNEMRKNLKNIISFNSNHEFTLFDKKINYHLIRVFNNSSFIKGGRFYGEIQNIKSNNIKTRQNLKIDNEETVEIDFSGLHPNMLYNMTNSQIKGKVYDIGLSINKKLIKKWILVSINAKDEKSARLGYYKWIRKTYNKNNPILNRKKRMEVFNLIDAAFKKYHPMIVNKLYSGCGIDLQYHDSCIMEKILLSCIDQKIEAYPIHDAIIVKKINANQAKEIMLNSYKDYMKTTFNLSIEPNIMVDEK
jgi:hypothetical protein